MSSPSIIRTADAWILCLIVADGFFFHNIFCHFLSPYKLLTFTKQGALNPVVKVFAACSPIFPLATSMTSEIQVEKWIPPKVFQSWAQRTVPQNWERSFFKSVVIMGTKHRTVAAYLSFSHLPKDLFSQHQENLMKKKKEIKGVWIRELHRKANCFHRIPSEPRNRTEKSSKGFSSWPRSWKSWASLRLRRSLQWAGSPQRRKKGCICSWLMTSANQWLR